MNRQILRLAIPNIISNITIPLLGMVDLGVVGYLGNDKYIGAVALGATVFNFVFWGFGFLRMGTTGFTAQAYGEKNIRETSLILGRSLLTAIAGGLFLLIFQWPIEKFAYFLINGSSEIENLSKTYFYIRIWAAPATISLYAFNGWFIGMQNTRFPMMVVITINVTNILLNFLFVNYFGMNVDGVALGSLIAQYTGLLLATGLYFRYYRKLTIHWKWKDLLNRQALERFFHVNKDIFVRTLCLITAFSFFTAKSASMNDQILAVNSLLLQFLFLFSYFIDGFAYAGEALSGKYIGAGNEKNLQTVVGLLFKWGIMLALPFSILYFFFGSDLLSILTQSRDVIEGSKPYLAWIGVIPLVTFAAFIWDGIYNGATASRPLRNSMLISTFLIFLPSYYFFKGFLGNHGLWLAMVLFMLSRSISLTILAKKNIKTSTKIR